jgi:hypothetical protein
MIDFGGIVARNRATFYNFATGKPDSQLSGYISKGCTCAYLSFVFSQPTNDFLNAIITVYSILVGFSFNILFYLLSSGRLTFLNKGEVSIEDDLMVERLNKLSTELFDNVSYFNLLSVAVLLTALISFLFDAQFSGFTIPIDLESHTLEMLQRILDWLLRISEWVYSALLYFLIIESIYSFIRTVGRVGFYFEKRLKIANKEG